MSLPFTTAEFFAVMSRYNEGVWPAQLVLYGSGLAATLLAAVRKDGASRAVAAIVAALWAWMGAVYHIGYFSAINPAATAFGVAFLAAAGLLAWEGVARGRLQFRAVLDARGWAGVLLIAYALAGYPLLAMALGHRYPAMPTFGLPCPTTILTIGVLAFARPPAPRSVFIVPVAWTLIGSQAALLFGVYEDLALIAAGVAALWFAFPRVERTRFA